MNKIIFITSLLNDRHYSKPFIYINTFNPQNNSVLLLLSNFHPLVFHTALRFPFFFLKDSILIIRVLKFFSSSAVLLCLFLLKDGTPNLYSRYGLTFGEPSGMSPLQFYVLQFYQCTLNLPKIRIQLVSLFSLILYLYSCSGIHYRILTFIPLKFLLVRCQVFLDTCFTG